MGQPEPPSPSPPSPSTAGRRSLLDFLKKNALLIVIALLMLLALGLLIAAAMPHGIFPLTISLATLPKSFLPPAWQQQHHRRCALRGSQQQVFPTTSITNGGQVVGGVPWPVPRYANPEDPATQEAYERQSAILLSTAVVAVSSGIYMPYCAPTTHPHLHQIHNLFSIKATKSLQPNARPAL